MPPSDQTPFAVVHPIEEAFVAFLRAVEGLNGLDIVAASNRDVMVPPLHCFVSCVEAVPLLARGPLYRADVRIVLVTNVDDTKHAERKVWANALASALTSATRFEHYVQTGDTQPTLVLEGWSLRPQREISDGQQTGDVIPVICGVRTAVGQTDDRPSTVD